MNRSIAGINELSSLGQCFGLDGTSAIGRLVYSTRLFCFIPVWGFVRKPKAALRPDMISELFRKVRGSHNS
jgi:hypothetical protein